MARTAEITRETNETKVVLRLCLDGTGESDIHSGVGFLDHMLTLLARHGHFDLSVLCKGDTWVDDHHSVEDVGICLGLAFREALGDKRGISRFGECTMPMDEALIQTAVDISGRSYLVCGLDLPVHKIGTFDSELAEEFFTAFTHNAGLNLHIRQLAGKNSHHIVEGAFKSLARALHAAVKIDSENPDELPSTKGVID